MKAAKAHRNLAMLGRPRSRTIDGAAAPKHTRSRYVIIANAQASASTL